MEEHDNGDTKSASQTDQYMSKDYLSDSQKYRERGTLEQMEMEKEAIEQSK